MTVPWADPAFNNANIAAWNEAEDLLRDHWGHGYLGEISASEVQHPPIPLTSGALTVHRESERIRALINETRERS